MALARAPRVWPPPAALSLASPPQGHPVCISRKAASSSPVYLPPPPAPVGLPTPATRHLLRPSRHSSLGPTTPVLLRNAGRTETSRLPAADSCLPTSPMGVVSSPASILRGRAEGCGGCRGGAGGARTLEPPPLPPPRPAGSSKGRIRTPAGLPSCRDGTPDPPTSFRSPLSPTTAATVFSTITT